MILLITTLITNIYKAPNSVLGAHKTNDRTLVQYKCTNMNRKLPAHTNRVQQQQQQIKIQFITV